MSRQTMNYENGRATQVAVVAGTSDLTTPTVKGSHTRHIIEFFNNDTATTIYLSTSPTYAVARLQGRPVAPATPWSDAATEGDWYVYADAGSVDVRITIVDQGGEQTLTP